MRWFTNAVGLLSFGVAITAGSAIPTHRSEPVYSSHPDRADAVKAAFQLSWDGYYKYAFPHDSLQPQNNSYKDDRNGWGASAIDAFSTAVVMENSQVIQQILDHVQNINFDNSVGTISLFETTIRYLGGLLSAYDLLQGPLNQYATNETAVANILNKARHLADNLAVGFNTTTGIPDNILLFDPPRTNGSTSNGLATIGTLILEWTRLSDLTGNQFYRELAERGQSYLMNPQPQGLAEPFPGLVGTNLNISNGLFTDGTGGWGGGDDSFYEYLLKMYLYDPVRFATYKDRWIAAADSSIKYLASSPVTRPDLTFLATFDNQTRIFQSGHLTCFDGGNFILGGLTLDVPRYIDFGLNLTAACRETYRATATGIGPEGFQWQDNGGQAAINATNNPAPPAESAAFAQEAGFWVSDSQYMLRPEVIESYYYSYRATGDAKYQEWAWDAFLAINKTCAVGSGYSSINDVNKAGGGGFQNFQESFWFAEVLKYSFLIQAPDADYQVQPDHTNKFVFNTECHPLLIPGGEQAHR
ncbi:mannosyl-oligosaccharide alpha-1,2-mannosidase precursor [Grosmannia clavigera kw1407]|uniref:alpha-1,2-Mannosidase n=1 Tax=Grosmannia clavigera (strain kw1407 / UAMH 11150) TaxID=655863 RepID=F0XHN9_GROCL|nr:mannosyl-oligosaccharide alpha-1,2-mannosidase precursor [Grosmannia clavigera kw1407]EFX03144.1 mannosyl-oligosaccharide alpha-1,2-mannosidase precursor [Grosmannia clavigera kw1407]